MSIIDVSSFNGKIEWDKVKDVELAIIRCGFGKNIKKQDDKQFVNNIEGALDSGIRVSAYIYSYATDKASAEGEASHAMRLLEDYKDKIDTVYLVCEEEGAKETCQEVVSAFCSILEDNGYKTGIRAPRSWFASCLKDIPADKRWVVFIDNTEPDVEYLLWNYTDKGTISGIDSDVSLSREKIVDKKIKNKPEPVVEKEGKKKKLPVVENYVYVASPNGLNIRRDAGRFNPIIAIAPYNSKLRSSGETKSVNGKAWLRVKGTANGVDFDGYCDPSFLHR